MFPPQYLLIASVMIHEVLALPILVAAFLFTTLMLEEGASIVASYVSKYWNRSEKMSGTPLHPMRRSRYLVV